MGRPRAALVDASTLARSTAARSTSSTVRSVRLALADAKAGHRAGRCRSLAAGGRRRLVARPSALDPDPRRSQDARDDNRDHIVGHRISIAFARETVTLVDTFGPVIRTPKHAASSWRVADAPTTLSRAIDARSAANGTALAAFVRAVEGKVARRVLADEARRMLAVAEAFAPACGSLARAAARDSEPRSHARAAPVGPAYRTASCIRKRPRRARSQRPRRVARASAW